MRSLSILICLLSMSFAGFSQNSVVSADKMNVLYIGVPNPVTIMAEGYSCAQTSVEAEGCIFTHKEGCSYEVMVTKPGTVLVKVNVKTGGVTKTIGKHQFRVKYTPDPVAMVAGRSHGRVPVAEFKAQIGVVATFLNFEYDARFKVFSFTMSITRGTTVLYEQNNQGGTFNSDAKRIMQTVRPGDRVVITDVKAAGVDSRVRSLNTIELELI